MPHSVHRNGSRSPLGAVATLILVGSLVSLGACGGEAPPADGLGTRVAAGAAAGYNVLLVTLDTVRWDHLGCYGREVAATPHLDRLVEDGVRFEQAVASTPLTLPSHATILTGLYPPRHGARDNGSFVVDEAHRTLAERLREAGYATAAFIGCFVLDARFGLDQGFDVYDFDVSPSGYRPQMPDFNERPANEVTDAALTWLAAWQAQPQRRPFFAWVHYFDPHLPYTSPLASLPRFADHPYDAEIAFVDQQFGRLLTALDRQELRQQTLILVVADHGEALGEHGEPTHGMLLYDATVRVPWIFSAPGLFAPTGTIHGQLAGLVDVRPTLEALLGLPADPDQDGVNLLRAEPDTERRIYLETQAPLFLNGWSPLYGLRSLRAKFVQAPQPEFYALPRDPGERRNLFRAGDETQADWVAELAARRAAWGDAAESPRAMSDEEIERLSSLGYVRTAPRATAGERPDPKAMMDHYRAALEAEELYSAGRFAEAGRLARQVLAACPECQQAIRVLAFAYLRVGEADQAVALLEESVAENPDPYLIRSLAKALILDQRYAPALEVLALYRQVAPDDGRAWLLLGDVRAQSGELEAALAAYRQAHELDEHRVGVRARERIAQVEGMLGGS